ncbi:MAG: hypothetical protein ACK4NE_03745 [Albidovulum sp.]
MTPAGKPGSRSFPVVDAAAIRHAFKNATCACSHQLGIRVCEAGTAKPRAELPKVRIWVQETGPKFMIYFLGRDAAGRDGTIKRFTEHMNPRFARVVARDRTWVVARGRWLFPRRIQHLPTGARAPSANSPAPTTPDWNG